VVKPEYALPLDPDYYLGRIDGTTLVAMGYADGHASCARAAAHPEITAPLTPEATKMKLSGPGVSFRQRLSGPYKGSQLRIDASVCIQDLDRFLTDPSHGGTVNATLDIPGVGERILSMRGRVTSAGSSGGLHYRLPFIQDGVHCLLDGTGPTGTNVLDEDLGMIAARLFRGSELLGAADVRMDAGALVSAVVSLHAIHAPSAAVAVETIARLGAFLFSKAFHRQRRRWWQFCKRRSR
jgi:hypothetical protein